jgi:hypothetical protein
MMYTAIRIRMLHVNTTANEKNPVEYKGFRRWCITLRMTGFVDFVHRKKF